LIFQRNDYIAPKILEKKSGNKGCEPEIGGGIESKSADRGMNVPLGFRRWTPLLERMILELESSNPRGALQLRRWWRSRCVLEREGRQGGKEMLQEKC
jgi:hypothetical protein